MSDTEKSREALMAELRATRQRADRSASGSQAAEPHGILASGKAAPGGRPPLKFLLGIEDNPYFQWQLPIFCESLMGQLPNGWEVLAVVCNDHAPISDALLQVFETYGVRYFTAEDQPLRRDIDFASGGEKYAPFNKIQSVSAIGERIEDDDLICVLDADNFLYGDLDFAVFPRRDAVCKNWMISEEPFFENRPEPGGVDLHKLLESIGFDGHFEPGGVAIFLSGRTVRNEKFARDCFRFTQAVFLLGRIAGLEKVWWAEMPCYALALAANRVETDLISSESFVIERPAELAPGSFYHYYGDIEDTNGVEGAFHGSKWCKHAFFDEDLLTSDLDAAYRAAVTDHEKRFFELAKRARDRLGRSMNPS